MKNWEYYKDELEKVNYKFALLHNGAVASCNDTECCDCEFSFAGINCHSETIKFLSQEHSEKYHILSQEEQMLHNLLNTGYLVKEQDGSLFWFENKPIKSKVNGIWKIDSNNTNESNHFVCLSNIFPQCKFDFIKWEDEEPYKINKHY